MVGKFLLELSIQPTIRHDSLILTDDIYTCHGRYISLSLTFLATFFFVESLLFGPI